MLQNQISACYHIKNPQNWSITKKSNPCYINVIPKMELNKYHDNIIIGTAFIELCSWWMDLSKYKQNRLIILNAMNWNRKNKIIDLKCTVKIKNVLKYTSAVKTALIYLQPS
jgi:hypothetical protein